MTTRTHTPMQYLIGMVVETEASRNDYHHRVFFSRAFEPVRWAYVWSEAEARQWMRVAKAAGYQAGTEYKRVDENW